MARGEMAGGVEHALVGEDAAGDREIRKQTGFDRTAGAWRVGRAKHGLHARLSWPLRRHLPRVRARLTLREVLI
jgi:hypothetical protein